MGFYAPSSTHFIHRIALTLLPVLGLACISLSGYGQTPDSLLPYNALKKMSLEELMNIEVVSVSRHPEKLDEAASAIQVITQDDIRRSGAKTLPEALRLAPNLQVAQVNSSQWAISARGFNNVLANKLLVLIDGRTVYTPLYAGVFWDVQNLLLEDIDRIEVISGPGGTLWGANAVNGVINIITKRSKDTKGLFAEAATGTAFPVLGSLRYGGQLSDKLSYRVYGTGFKLGNTLRTKDTAAHDAWPMIQGGFRLDWDASAKDKISLQSNIYGGKPNPDGGDTAVKANGDNIVARWDHQRSENSAFRLQAYYDHTLRDFGNGFSEDLKTWDMEWQDRYQLGSRHILTYGLDLRVMDHRVTNLELFKFLPGHKTLTLYSGFVQDEIMLIRDRLRFTAGAKVEHNSYTGFEYQPNARLTWTPAKNQTIWGAVSRAVRTPARIDRDFYLYLLPTLPFIEGNETFRSENMIAYEAGWRTRPLTNLQLSLSAFYNVYDNIRSAEPGPPPFYIPVTFGNGVKGDSYGIELSATSQLTSWWSLRGGYTFLKKDLSVKPGSQDSNKGSAESDDPEHQFLLQSNLDLPGGIEFGTVLRYISKLPSPRVSDYTGLDLRIGWKLNKVVELDVVGQNLLNSPHTEFVPSSPAPRQIEHSIYGKIICRL
jgi:iron complex outermembrane receptor protein